MKRFCLSIFVLILAGASASAQNTLRTAYFLDGYTASYKLNPALGNDRGFFSIPLLGNVNVNSGANFGLSTFLFQDGNGNLNTFLSDAVSAEEFLKGISDNTSFNPSVDMSLLALGFHAGKTFHTIDISLRADASANVPGEMLKFMKQGSSDASFTRLGMSVSSMAQASYGVQFPIGEKLSFGIRGKFLWGLAKVDCMIDDVRFSAHEDRWTSSAKGTLNAYGPVYIKTLEDDGGIQFDVKDVQGFSDFPRSFGGAIDLGFKYEISPSITLSASIADLGIINWDGYSMATTSGNTWEYDGFEDISNASSINDQLDEIVEDLKRCFLFTKRNSSSSATTTLSPTIMTGLEVKMPFYERLSAGLLGTAHLDNVCSWYEARVSANLALSDFFSCSASVAGSTFGVSTGAALNLHATGFSLFIGSDNLLPWTKVSKQYIPVNSLNTSLTAGVNITFGRKTSLFEK